MKPLAVCISALVLLAGISTTPALSAQTFSLVSPGCGGGTYPDNDYFNINGEELRTSEVLDRETKDTCTICVRTTDAGGAMYEEEMTITVNDTTDVIINEVDVDQTGTDNAEFVELYDGGVGNTPLDGYVLVFFNGDGDVSYWAVTARIPAVISSSAAMPATWPIVI